MLDPLEPIPSPTAPTPTAQQFWQRSGPPPAPRQVQSTHRVQPAHRVQPDEFPAPGHEPVDTLLGLCTAQGWALMRTLSLAPEGLLLRLVDLVSPDVSLRDRRRGRQALHRLAPHLGTSVRLPRAGAATSPLATVGHAVLSRKVVEDLSAQIAPRHGLASSSRGPRAPVPHVSVIIPLGAHAPSRPQSPHVARIPGTLVPRTDPDPHVLAVSIGAEHAGELRTLLASSPAASPTSPRAVELQRAHRAR